MAAAMATLPKANGCNVVVAEPSDAQVDSVVDDFLRKHTEEKRSSGVDAPNRFRVESAPNLDPDLDPDPGGSIPFCVDDDDDDDDDQKPSFLENAEWMGWAAAAEDTTAEDTTAEDTTAEDTTAEDTTTEDTTTEDTTAKDTTAVTRPALSGYFLAAAAEDTTAEKAAKLTAGDEARLEVMERQLFGLQEQMKKLTNDVMVLQSSISEVVNGGQISVTGHVKFPLIDEEPDTTPRRTTVGDLEAAMGFASPTTLYRQNQDWAGVHETEDSVEDRNMLVAFM